jgi:hypothetical protein
MLMVRPTVGVFRLRKMTRNWELDSQANLFVSLKDDKSINLPFRSLIGLLLRCLAATAASLLLPE